ncbi:MAG TPA: hypothetical protein VLA61_10755 [Ideonella sp.]|uniref:hypothetical protein n=1 Tax=Ideonella sp. TaxID=1929293 RepID=UPI002CD2636A|nr:hypothetical protein [Ideonella sp.]HSI48741.1 hypothetical protein [Ideonella sp.]
MKKLDVPTTDDESAFIGLVNNTRLKSFPHLKDLVVPVRAAYKAYKDSFDSPIFVFRPPTNDQAAYLLGHFNSPPKDIGFIKAMRKVSDSRECSMCGSLHSGTLDHYLSKNTFPQFAVFSKNLVPACKCNSKRGEKLHGDQPGERILHPYYDECMNERIVRAQFDDLGAVPRVSLELTIPRTHVQYAAISFHVREIIQKSAIKGYLADRWSNLFRKPSLAVRAFEKNFVTEADVQRALSAELAKLDDSHGGKNNWNSVFVRGLLEPPTLAWLTSRLSNTVRPADAPLG